MKNFYKTIKLGAIALMFLFSSLSNCRNILASGSADGTIKIWDVGTGECIKTLPVSDWRVEVVEVSSDGKMLFSGDSKGVVKVWDLVNGVCIKTLNGHTGAIFSMAFHPDQAMLASGSWDRTVRLWNIETGACIATLKGHSGVVNLVAFSPDGTMLASGCGYSGEMRLWDLQTFAQINIAVLEKYFNQALPIAFSPDKKMLALWVPRKCLEVVNFWDVVKKGRAKPLKINIKKEDLRKIVGILSIAFSPDGTKLASGSGNGVVGLWDVKKRKLVRLSGGDMSFVRAVAFSPDGTIFASGANDRLVKIWSSSTSMYIKQLEGHAQEVLSLVFLPVDIEKEKARIEAEEERMKFLMQRMGGLPGVRIKAKSSAPLVVPMGF